MKFILLSLVGLILAATELQSCQDAEQRLPFGRSNVYIRLVRTTKLGYQIMKGSQILETISLDNFDTTQNLQPVAGEAAFTLSNGVSTIKFSLISPASSGVLHLRIERTNVDRDSQPMDCVSLDIGKKHWFAGPEDRYQYWPLERQVFSNYSYLTKEDHNAGIAERYWLNSQGTFFYVDEDVPLFIEQNSEGHANQLCFKAMRGLPYDARVEQLKFSYHVGFASNAKVAHMYAIQNILGRPTAIVDERMVRDPIWSTWALYKADINDSIVREFGKAILDNGFKNSQLEIDDDWEDCYGALTFRKSKFPNIKQLTDDLKGQGFRVTLWIHPFINKNCESIYAEAKRKGFLVLDHNGNADTQWWNSGKNEAAYVDFTKEEAKQWFSDRLKRLQIEDGIDSFKFDAGETSWVPPDPVLQGNISPIEITREYVRTVGAFGPVVEVRSGQSTQDLPIFVRMIDKDSEWGWNNGLVTLITTLLQMNLNGYPFVLPDMIGGNGYNNKPPTKELFLRWLQANVFMPSLQFSYVPWNFDSKTISLSKKFTELHSQYTAYIMKCLQSAVDSYEPVNVPLWWLDPEDIVAQGIYDEFALGNDIIAAPVVQEGAVMRDIYLPQGEWIDGNDNTKKPIVGPIWLMSYPAPLDTLPYFLRKGVEF